MRKVVIMVIIVSCFLAWGCEKDCETYRANIHPSSQPQWERSGILHISARVTEATYTPEDTRIVVGSTPIADGWSIGPGGFSAGVNSISYDTLPAEYQVVFYNAGTGDKVVATDEESYKKYKQLIGKEFEVAYREVWDKGKIRIEFVSAKSIVSKITTPH